MKPKSVDAGPRGAGAELEEGGERRSWFRLTPPAAFPRRGLKDMELDTSSIEKRFAFGFLQQLLRWMDISQEFIAHLGTEKPLPDAFPTWDPVHACLLPLLI